MQLRDYQQRDLENIRHLVRAGQRRILYVLATGGGKTVMVSNIAQRTMASGRSFFFVVHRRELVTQSSNTFDLCGIPHGIIAPGFTETNDAIQVVSIDALDARMRRGKKYQPSVICWDEAHHAASPKWGRVSQAISNERTIHIGLTATPERLDGKGLDTMFDTMILGKQTRELISDKYLCEFDHYAPPPKIPLERLRMLDGDFYQPALRDLVDDPAVIGDAVQHYREIAQQKRAIVFCAGIKHSQHTAEIFRAAGISAAHIDGKDTNNRVKALAAFERGELQVITNCDIVSEGFDVPAMECVIMLRPTDSLTLYIQQAGRALRKDKNNPNKRAIILDHAGNFHRHGEIDRPREWSLLGRKKRKQAEESTVFVPSVKQCPVCFMAHRPAPACPSCGNVYKTEERLPDQLDGKLSKVTDETALAYAKKKNIIEVARAKSLQELEEIAAQRGYAKGWAWMRWKHHRNNPVNNKRYTQGVLL